MRRTGRRVEEFTAPVGGTDTIVALSEEAPTSTDPSGSSRVARAVALRVLRQMHGGAIIVREGGRRRLCGRPVAGEAVPEIEVLSPRFWRALLADGGAGLGRAWFSGYCNSPSLDELTLALEVLARNVDRFARQRAVLSRLGGPLRRVRQTGAGRPGDPATDRENIRRHYDLGDEFFAAFLDDTMTYSCAIFDGPEMGLREAQIAKLDRLCRKLNLSAADEVLEIGTGWGSFAIHAAGRYGCRVTTTTISANQFATATARVRAAGLEGLVTVVNRDYRQLTGSFDKVVSIEMIEALDWRQYDTYFAACSQLLKPDGLLGIQAIVIADQHFERAKRHEDFIKRYIFPGSCLPSVAAILSSTARRTDLQLIALDDIGSHYAETIRRWRRNFTAARTEIAALDYGETFLRCFEFYLCYSEAGFAERRISDVQCVFAKPAWRSRGLVPPTA